MEDITACWLFQREVYVQEGVAAAVVEVAGVARRPNEHTAT